MSTGDRSKDVWSPAYTRRQTLRTLPWSRVHYIEKVWCLKNFIFSSFWSVDREDAKPAKKGSGPSVRQAMEEALSKMETSEESLKTIDWLREKISEASFYAEFQQVILFTFHPYHFSQKKSSGKNWTLSLRTLSSHGLPKFKKSKKW